MKEALEDNADDGQALAHIEEQHREFLEAVIIQDDAEGAVETKPTSATEAS